jgi:hypothetical protein
VYAGLWQEAKQLNNTSAIVASNYDSHTYQACFLASLKTRFPQLIFTEQKDSSEKKDTTVLMTSSPSRDLASLKITLFKDDINIEIPGIRYRKRYNPSTIPVTVAPDADHRIPPRLQALDFIQKIIEDKILFRCYRHKGKIIRTEIVSVLSDTVEESKTYTIRGSFVKFSSKYEVSDCRWSGSQTDKV